MDYIISKLQIYNCDIVVIYELVREIMIITSVDMPKTKRNKPFVV
jgi:hypothetical protein